MLSWNDNPVLRARAHGDLPGFKDIPPSILPLAQPPQAVRRQRHAVHVRPETRRVLRSPAPHSYVPLQKNLPDPIRKTLPKTPVIESSKAALGRCANI